MKQFLITSRPRHLRYIFFVDEKYPYEEIFKLMCSNLKLWGGRINPIIPVKENVISVEYINLLKYYDPDFIFHNDSIDPEIIKELRIFNPCGYFNLSEKPRKEDITGVDAFYLISLLEGNSKILLPRELWKTKSPLLDFYKLNFGIESDAFLNEYEIGRKKTQIVVNPENFSSINEIIHKEKPIIQSNLSRINLNTKILRNLQHAKSNAFEIVVAKDNLSTQDLFYYWNRLLFEGRNILYITIDELNLLSNDKFFGAILYDLSSEDFIHVVSMSLNREEIQKVIDDKLTPISIYKPFRFKDISNFPFEILDDNGLFERNYGETFTTQTIISEKGLFQLPHLSFTNKVEYYSQRWIVDVDIKKFGENYQNETKFPFTTDTQYVFKSVKGRINKRRNISIIIRNQQDTSDTLEIRIPEFNQLLRQLIINPIIQGESKNTKYIDINYHDDSNKLSAFINAFNCKFTTIDDFFSDEFWVSIFEELITSEKMIGDSISFNEIMIKSKALLAAKKIIQLDEGGKIIGKKGETYKNEENLELGLKETIKELCNYHVFLKGFNLKCEKCSSQFWYHINEIGEMVNCKGCLDVIQFPIEPQFAYKLNDLIKNNIYQSKTNRDGNLTVIRTLASLHDRSLQSFQYSPQINLYNNIHENHPCAEIDIVCLLDGQLIIGEAKHDSRAFSADSNKALHSLVEVAKEIKPDRIILSCYVDTKDKLDKAKQGLIHIFNKWEYQPEIEVLHLVEANDFHLGGHRYFFY